MQSCRQLLHLTYDCGNDNKDISIMINDSLITNMIITPTTMIVILVMIYNHGETSLYVGISAKKWNGRAGEVGGGGGLKRILRNILIFFIFI